MLRRAVLTTTTGTHMHGHRLAARLAARQGSHGGVLLHQQSRAMGQNHSVQQQWVKDTADHGGGRGMDYDFDKERWARQMKFASLDCIMEPSVEAPKYTSFAGLKKYFRRYLNMKKLNERRPGFSRADLEEVFKAHRRLSRSRDLNDVKLLMRVTTHTEATRIQKDIEKRANEAFRTQSWGSLKLGGGMKQQPKKQQQQQQQQKQQQNASTTEASSTETNNANTNTSAAAAETDRLMSAAANANDVVLAVRPRPSHDVQVLRFELVATYMAQMASEDWLQLTYRCEFMEKDSDATNTDSATSKDGESSTSAAPATSASASSPSSSATAESTGAAKAASSPADVEKQLLAAGYTKHIEYPVFEVRLGDGAKGAVQYPFVVVGVMRRDGTRYGRDAQDAAQLRKQFDKNNKWF